MGCARRRTTTGMTTKMQDSKPSPTDPVFLLSDVDLQGSEDRADLAAASVKALTAHIRSLQALVLELQAVAPRPEGDGVVHLEAHLRDWRLADGLVEDSELPAYAREPHAVRVVRDRERVVVSLGNEGAEGAEGADQAARLVAVFEISAGVPTLRVHSQVDSPARSSIYGFAHGVIVQRQEEIPPIETGSAFAPDDTPIVLRRILRDEGFIGCDKAGNPLFYEPGDALVFRGDGGVEIFIKHQRVDGTTEHAQLRFELSDASAVLSANLFGDPHVITRREMALDELSQRPGSAVSELLMVIPGVISEVRDYVQRQEVSTRI